MIENEEDFDEEKFERECEIIDEMFPNAGFSVCIDLDEMNEVISNKNMIVIQIKPCSVPCRLSGNRQYFYVRNQGNGITNKDMIQALIDSDYHPICDHHFLEGFYETNETTFEPHFGS